MLIDNSKIGYQGTAFFLISCTKDQSKQSTINALTELKVFQQLDRVIGGAFDIFASAKVKDLRHLGSLTNKIEKNSEIENIEVSTLLFTYYSFTPKPFAPCKCDNIELS